jgi:hypothetical protein
LPGLLEEIHKIMKMDGRNQSKNMGPVEVSSFTFSHLYVILIYSDHSQQTLYHMLRREIMSLGTNQLPETR